MRCRTDLLQFAKAGAQVIGIDLTPRSIELTSRRFELYGTEGSFEMGDAENLSFIDETFDLVYSHGVLRHSPKTQKAVEEIYRPRPLDYVLGRVMGWALYIIAVK